MIRRHFIFKLILFTLPTAAILSLPIMLAVYMGEAMPLRSVVALQMGETPVLYGTADRDVTFAYKLMAVQTRQPEVLFIGSSRVLQYRSALLNRNSDAFYNAGGEGWGLREVRALVEQLDLDSAPRILVLGLDQVWFNADFVDWEEPHDLHSGEIDLNRVFATTKKVIDNLLLGEIQFETMLERRGWVRGAFGLGLNALKSGRGYRNDGSFQEGNVIVNPELGELARTTDLERAPEGWRQFIQGDAVSEPMLAELESFLQLAQEKGIFVIGFSPPYMPSIYEIMIEGDKTDYIALSTARMESLFEQYDYAYFDFSNAAWIGGSDEELYDGWHSTELLCLRAYMVMLESLPAVLGPYSDLAGLEQIAARAENPIEVFGNEF